MATAFNLFTAHSLFHRITPRENDFFLVESIQYVIIAPEQDDKHNTKTPLEHL